MPILVHGTLASRERAPRHWDWRAANLWVAAFLGGVAAGEGGGTHRGFVCRRFLSGEGNDQCGVLRRPVAQRWRLVAAIASCAKCQGSFAGNQTLAAMVFQSEAQDKAESTEFNAETSTRSGSGRGALELACLL